MTPGQPIGAAMVAVEIWTRPNRRRDWRQPEWVSRVQHVPASALLAVDTAGRVTGWFGYQAAADRAADRARAAGAPVEITTTRGLPAALPLRNKPGTRWAQ